MQSQKIGADTYVFVTASASLFIREHCLNAAQIMIVLVKMPTAFC